MAVVARAHVGTSEELTPEGLCNEYASLICRFAVYATRDQAEAEDIAQEALIRAIRNLGRYDSRRGSLNTWLWTIVARTAKDMARARARRVALLSRLSSLSQHRPTIEEIALQHLADEEIVDAIRRLAPRDRILIGLRFSAGLGIAEIARVTHTSSGAAGKAMRRALDRLKQQLEVL